MVTTFILDLQLIGRILSVYGLYCIIDLSYKIFVKKHKVYWNLKGVSIKEACFPAKEVYWTTILIAALLLWLGLELAGYATGG